MKIWSDIMNSLMNIINNSTFYYVAVALAYVLVIFFVIFLLVKNKRKRIERVKIEDASKKDIESVDLEAVLDKMQEDVNKTKVDEVKSFEEEQEEKAIISYQELLKAVKKDVDDVTKVEIPSEEKPVVVEDEEAKVQIMPEEVIEKSVSTPVVETMEEKETRKPSKFQNSEFISPIYGRVNNDVKYPKIPAFREKQEPINHEDDLEKTIVFDAIKNDDNDEFLKALKEFRNNLE
jgi:hypothetical protein